jgi:hypothetical protein
LAIFNSLQDTVDVQSRIKLKLGHSRLSQPLSGATAVQPEQNLCTQCTQCALCTLIKLRYFKFPSNFFYFAIYYKYLSDFPQPLGQTTPALGNLIILHRNSEGFAIAHQHAETFGARHRGIQQIALQPIDLTQQMVKEVYEILGFVCYVLFNPDPFNMDYGFYTLSNKDTNAFKASVR